MRIFGYSFFEKEVADATAVAYGNPAETQQTDQADPLSGLNLAANPGPSHQKLTLGKKSVPTPDQHEALIKYIKQIRSQFRIRKFVEEYVDQVTHGLRIKGTPEIERFARNANLYSTINKVLVELRTIGWCVVYVSEVENQPISMTVLHNVVVKKSVAGNPIIYLKLDTDAKDAVSKQSKYYPQYWGKEVETEQGINITRLYSDPEMTKWTQGGAYFIRVEPDGEDMFPVPPIYPLLLYVLNSEKILEGMTNMVDMVKLYLIHVKLGNELGQDLRDGRIRSVSQDRISKVIQFLSMGYKVGAIVTPGDVSIEQQFLDKSPYAVNNEAVDAFNKLMLGDSGLPAYEHISSEGVAAFIAKRMLPTVDKLRQIVMNQWLKPMFEDLNSRGVKGADSARIVWNDMHMFELKTIIDKVKVQLSTGGCSIEYLNEQFDPDYNFEAEMKRKELEQKSAATVGMIWEPSQGQSDKGMEQAKITGAKPVATPAIDPNADQGGRPTN